MIFLALKHLHGTGSHTAIHVLGRRSCAGCMPMPSLQLWRRTLFLWGIQLFSPTFSFGVLDCVGVGRCFHVVFSCCNDGRHSKNPPFDCGDVPGPQVLSQLGYCSCLSATKAAAIEAATDFVQAVEGKTDSEASKLMLLERSSVFICVFLGSLSLRITKVLRDVQIMF